MIFQKCGACHRPGGSAPFSLLTYPAVRQRAPDIAAVTRSRLMPPWKAEPGYGGAFVGQHPLTAAEIRLIERWVESGAPEGDPTKGPPRPEWADGWQLGQPDLIVKLSQPYTLQAEGTDAFRIFVLPLPVGEARYVTGLEFRPGNSRVVHHANIRIDRTPASRELDRRDPAPGYDGLMARSAVYPDGHFLGWTPGQIAPLLPGDLAWRLDAGTDLVVQLHMQPSGKPEVVEPSIGLFFLPRPVRLESQTEPPVPTPSMLRLGRQNIDIPAGEKAYTIADSYVLPSDVDAIAVQPHAHYRAREIKGTAALPDGTTKWLIYIKEWDFRWQHVYRYVEPVQLPKGTRIEMQYTYDNSEGNARNPQRPPKRVRWGQKSSDEMGDLWVQLLPRVASDRVRLNAGIRSKMAAEDAVGYQTLLESATDDVELGELHDELALLCLELGRFDVAVAEFAASSRLKPQSAAAHFNLGTALTMAGKLEEAIVEYERALAIRRDYSGAHNNLGKVLETLGRTGEAVDHYREAVRIDPNNTEARRNLEGATKRKPKSEVRSLKSDFRLQT